ncbi:MAG: metal ABC transporter permease [Planctomycetota bacterium]
MDWSSLDTRIVLIASLAAIACVLPGTFLVLKRMSMLTHAIAHAVLPGLVIAFLFVGSSNLPGLMIGALIAGIVTTMLVQWLSSKARIEQGVATGIVFTALFALGIVLLRTFADRVHLHADCIIEGQLTLAAARKATFLGIELPRAAWLLLTVIGVNGVLLAIFWRPIVASVLDPDHARLNGMRPEWMQQLLMVMTAVTTIAAFEAVGSILVIALIVVPVATAILLSDRLIVVFGLALAIGVLCAVLGHVLAVVVPGPLTTALLGSDLGGRVDDTSSAGAIAVTYGIVFLLTALLFGRDAPLRKRLRATG